MNLAFKVLIGTAFLAQSSAVFAEENNLQLPVEMIHSESGKGDLQVSIESSPLLGSTPRGATRIEVATLNLSASCDQDIRIDGIRVTHVGLGDSADISAVYVHDGLRRVSRSKQFDRRSQSADLRVTSFTVRKCEAVRLNILFDISSNAAVASEHGVEIKDAASISSTAKTTTLLRTDTTRRVITSPKDVGSVTVHFLPIKGPLRYGRQETVARIQLTADAKNDHLLKSVTFTNLSDARDMNLINFTLETKNGNILSPVSQRMRGLQVKLDFDPTYILERGKTVVLLLKSTINASQSKKINFTIQEPSDLYSTPYRPSR